MWNLIDYIPWVVVFDFNSLIFFSSLLLAKSSLCAHRYLMQNVWIELKFNTSDFHPLHEFRMVILEKCPPHLTDTERIQFSIMRCSIVLERFFFYLWVCANLCLYTFHLPTMHESNAHHDTGRCSSRKTFEQKQNKQ